MYINTGMRQGEVVSALLFCLYLVSQNGVIAIQPTISGNNYLTENVETNFTCTSVLVKTGPIEPDLIIKWRLQSLEQENLSVHTFVIPYNQTVTVRNSTIVFLPIADHHLKRLYCTVSEMTGLKRNYTDSVILYVTHATTPAPDVPIARVSKGQHMVAPGSEITMNCTIQSSLEITEIYWRKISNGNLEIRPSTNPDKYGITNNVLSSPKTSVLKIQNLDNSNAGGYVCHAVPSSGSPGISNTVQVYVITFSLSSFLYNRPLGGSVTLDCTMTGLSGLDYTIQWYRNGQPLNLNTDSRYVNGNKLIPSLTINNLQAADSGKYTCQINSGTDSLTSPEITLNVQSSVPQVTVSTLPYIVNVGENVNLTCSINENVLQVYWTKRQTNQRYTTSPAVPHLTFNGVTASQAGSYICSAVSSASGLTGNSSEVSLVVIDTLQTQYTETVGREVTLYCNVNSPIQDYSISWYKDGSFLNVAGNPSKYEGGSTSLKIKSLTTNDDGLYYCTVTFSGGTSRNSANIDLNILQGNAPGVTVPTSPYIVNSGESVTLTCTVNEAASSVYWTKEQTGERFTTSPSSPFLTLNSVTASNAGSYVCNAVSATNGLTGKSSPVNLVVIDPVQTQYTETTGRDVTLTCNINSPTQSYSILWYKDGNYLNIAANPSKYEGGTASSTWLKIKSLTASDAGVYVCQVRFNDGTSRDSSNINLAVSPGNPPQVSIVRSTYIANAGDSVILGCSVNEAVSRVYWTKTQTGETFETSPSSPFLTLNGVKSSNAGSYICKAVSTATGLTGTSPPVSLIVIDSGTSQQYNRAVADDVTLPCSVNSPTQSYSVSWYKNNVFLNVLSNPAKYSGGTTNTPPLTIRSLSANDQGVYYCRVTFADGTRKNGANLNLSVLSVTVPSTQYFVNDGATVTISCVSSTTNLTDIYWVRTLSSNGIQQRIYWYTSSRYTGITRDNPSINIISINSGDAGEYVCHVRSATGVEGRSETVNVNVIRLESTSYTPVPGGSITLKADIFGPSISKLNWYKDNVLMSIDGTKYRDGNTAKPSLTLSSLTASDSGVYKFTASNNGQSYTSPDIRLSVQQGNAPGVTVRTSPYIVNSGDSVTLTCTVNEAASSVYWTKEQTGERFTTSSSSPSLTLNSVTAGNAGSYVCNAVSATNGLTGKSLPVNLVVIDSGTSQQYNRAVADDVTLPCSINSPTQSYSVSWFKNNVNLNVASNPVKYSGGTTNTPPLTIRSLSANDQGVYYCRVTFADGTSKNGADLNLNVLSVTVQSTQYFVNDGATVTISCVSSTTNLTDVYWVRTLSSNGLQQRIYWYTSSRYTGITRDNPSINIISINSGDAGEYVCHVRSATGVEGRSETVNVNVIRLESTSYTRVPGGSITLKAEIDGPSISTLNWYKDNLLMSIDGTKYRDGNTAKPSLTLSSLTASDSGVYKFTASNNRQSYTSPDIRLSVQQATAPQVTLQSSYIGLVGGYIILQCTVAPMEGLLSLSWTLPSGSTDLSNPVNKYVGGTKTAPPLRIYSLNPVTDNGVYTCRATNSAGTGSASTTLTVYKAPENVQITPTSLSINSGEPIQLTCTGDGMPTQDYRWYKGSTLLNDFDSTYYIPSASASDGGSYMCNVSNMAGYKTDTMTVTVITVSDQQYTKRAGESVTLDCNVSGLTSFSITWYKNGQEIRSRGTKYFNGNSAQPSLTINPLISSDSGVYVCSVNGPGVLKNSSNINLFVGSIPVVSIPESKYTGSVGSFVTIPCNVNPRSNLDSVKWYLNGAEILVSAQPSKYQNGNRLNPDITILQLSPGDNGNYQCTATNALGTGRSQQAQLTVFSVNVPSTRYRPLEGQSVTLTCSAALSSYTVTWYKDGQRIILPSSGYQNGIFPVPSLTINNVDIGDSGIYVCSVTSGGFTKNGSSIDVAVQQQLIAPDNVMTFTPSSVSVRAGERIQVSANAGGSPDPVYRWSKNGVVVYTGQTLVIDSASASNSGLYTVTASNSAGETNGTLMINVQTQEVTVSNTAYNALVGDSVVMGCTVQGVANYIITWYKDGQVLVRTSRHQNGNRNIPTLTITSITRDDAGNYICSATNLNNGESTNSSVVTLSVGVIAPRNIRIIPATLTTLKGTAINLQCVADGTSVVYTWTKGGTKLRDNALLYIQDADRFDDGVYNCTATNGGGSASATINVDVQYPPVITTTITTVTTNIGSTVTFYCENDADPPATNYEWKYGDVTDLLSSSSLTVDIVDDNSFIDYTCTAINIHGSSEPHTFSLVKETAPVAGASVGGGLSIIEILAILLGLILLLLLLLLLIYCCYMRGCCGACCGKCCGKKKKDSKGRVSPGIVYATKPKATVHHIEIPRFYEVPIPNWKPKSSSTASAVSRRDVHMMAGPEYYRSDEYEINAKMHLNANLSDGGTIISMYDDRLHTPRDYHLPPLDYPVVKKEGKKKKRKKKHHHHRSEAEGQEDSHLVNGAM